MKRVENSENLWKDANARDFPVLFDFKLVKFGTVELILSKLC